MKQWFIDVFWLNGIQNMQITTIGFILSMFVWMRNPNHFTLFLTIFTGILLSIYIIVGFVAMIKYYLDKIKKVK